MSVEFVGLNHLDSNSYENIIIIEDKLNTSYRVNIKERKKDCDVQLPLESNNFYNKIKDLSEPQKVEQIIYCFLRNNKIVSLSDTQIIPGYQNLFNIIKGDNASLALRLFCDKKILSDCANKYELDRLNFLNQNNNVICYEVFTSENTSSYNEEVYFGQKIIQLTLIKKDEKFWWKDEKFLKEWILGRLEEQGVYAELEHWPKKHQEKDISDIPKLICGNLIIYLPDNLVQRLVKQIVREYNQSLENQKSLQLKMEGL